MRTFGRCMASAIALMICLFWVHPAFAAATQGSVTGVVIDASTGANIAGAKLTLTGSGKSFSTTSDSHGAFGFTNIDPGTWVLRTIAVQYQLSISGELKVTAGKETALSVALQPVSTTNITTLGRVTVQGHRALNTSSAAAVTITANDYANTGTTQIQQLLETTPGLTIEHFDNGAPGNVATFTIRGAGGFAGGNNTGYEILVLQDGEPVRNGQFGDADLSAFTPAIYSRTEVVKGVGGTSLFGANTVGGTLNLVTIDPKATEGAEAIVTVGTYGSFDYNLSQTNTYGRLGYVLDYHGYGTDGYIPSQLVVDIPPCTFCFGINTAPIGTLVHPTEAMNLKSGLGKIKYNFSANSYGVLTYTDEADTRDQLGLLGNPETVTLASNFSTFATDPFGNPYWFGFPVNYVQNTSPKTSFEVHSVLGGGALLLRYYNNWINRWIDGNHAPPANCCFLQKSIDHLTGTLASWDKAFGNHDFTIALGGNSDTFDSGNCGAFGFTCAGFENSSSGFPPDVPVIDGNIDTVTGTQIERTVLLRDDYEMSAKFRATLAGYYSSYTGLNVKRFDPRLALVNRPDDNTVIRASVGTGFAAPRLSDLVTPLNLSPFSSVSGPNCPTDGSNTFCNATSGNPNVKQESALGYDVSYERTWGTQGDFSIDLYRTNLHDHIFDAILPAPPNLFFSGTTTPVLGIFEPINLAGSVYTGIEFSGSLPVTNEFAIKGYYNTQAAYPFGVDLATQQNLGNVVNDNQYQGIPLHKVGYSVNFQNGQRVSAFFGGDWFGPNNAYNVPQFWIYNGGITLPYSRDTMLHIALHNIFNKNALIFSNFNGGVPYPTIPGFSGCPGSGPCVVPTTAFSAAPHSISVSLDTRWGSLK